MTAMSYMPYITWNIVPYCSSHYNLQDLKNLFYTQKDHAKDYLVTNTWNIHYKVN